LLKSSHGSEDEGLLKGKLVIGTQKSKTLYGGPNNRLSAIMSQKSSICDRNDTGLRLE
jgi:hypothetical protein